MIRRSRALYLVVHSSGSDQDGECTVYYGDDLQKRVLVRKGEQSFVAADMPHAPRNQSPYRRHLISRYSSAAEGRADEAFIIRALLSLTLKIYAPAAKSDRLFTACSLTHSTVGRPCQAGVKPTSDFRMSR